MTFTTFVMFDMFNALCCRSADKIVPQMDMFANKAFIYSVGGSLLGQVRVVVFSKMHMVGFISGGGIRIANRALPSASHTNGRCIALHDDILRQPTLAY